VTVTPDVVRPPAAAANDSLWMAGEVGTNYGGERETDDWVSVTTADVPIATGEFAGHVVCRPRQDLPTADVAVYWQRHREHHPLERYPAQGGELDGPPLHLGKKIPMHGGTEFGLPFALPLPADAAQTSSAVHSSLSCFIGARIFYSGFSRHQIEGVRRPIVVVNAP
jgi:hypothetical protein